MLYDLRPLVLSSTPIVPPPSVGPGRKTMRGHGLALFPPPEDKPLLNLCASIQVNGTPFDGGEFPRHGKFGP